MAKKSVPAIASFLNDLKHSGVTPINESSVPTANKSAKSFDLGINSNPDNKSYSVKKISTDKIKLWKMANRLVINDDNTKDLVESIKLNGQRIPAIVRPAQNGYELICGARRLYACNKLGLELLVAIVDITDQEAVTVMDIENRERLDISPYERGTDYKRWVEEGIYKNYAQISDSIGIKKALLSKYVKLATIDKRIVAAFHSPADITIKWGHALASMLEKDPSKKESLVLKAESLLGKGLSARQVYHELITSFDKQKRTSASKDIIKALNGEAIAVLNNSNGKISINFNETLDESKINKIKNFLSNL